MSAGLGCGFDELLFEMLAWEDASPSDIGGLRGRCRRRRAKSKPPRRQKSAPTVIFVGFAIYSLLELSQTI